MKSSFLRLFTTAAVALALTSVVSFAEEPAKTDAPAPAAEPAKTAPAEAPKSGISSHCGKCDKKDEPSTAPATEPAKTEPAKQEEAPEKKDGEKCPGCPTEAPKA